MGVTSKAFAASIKPLGRGSLGTLHRALTAQPPPVLDLETTVKSIVKACSKRMTIACFLCPSWKWTKRKRHGRINICLTEELDGPVSRSTSLHSS